MSDYVDISKILSFHLDKVNDESNTSFRTMQVATIGKQKEPNCRTVILRKVNLKRQTLFFFSDIRSAKISEIKQNPNVALHLYDSLIQFRFSATCHVQYQSRLSDIFFNELGERGKRNYATAVSPGSLLSEAESVTYDLAKAYDNFCVCVCNFTQVDIVNLNEEPHTRIVGSWDKYGNCTSSQCVP